MESVTVVPRERMRTRHFALALEGATTSDPSLTQMTRVAGALNAAGGSNSFGNAAAAPSDDFRAALRQRLVAVGAVAPVRPRGGLPQAAPWRRRLVAASAVLAISTGGAAATAVASTGALPGDRLYEVKRAVENVQLALAPSDLAKGERYLAIASARMAEVQGLLRESGGNTSDPVLVEELRSTLSDMSDSIAAGSDRYFTVYNRTLDAGVLLPLEQFLEQRSLGLAEVREFLPAELLDKQGSMLVEIDRIARRVATATGREPVTVLPDVPSSLSMASGALVSASRAQNERDLGMVKLPLDRAVRALGSALNTMVGEAVAKFPSNSAPAAKPVDKTQAEKEFRRLVAVDTDSSQGGGMTLGLLPGRAALPHANIGILHETGEEATTASSRLLGGLNLPTTTLDAAVPGSLSAALDIDLTRLGANVIPLHKDKDAH